MTISTWTWMGDTGNVTTTTNTVQTTAPQPAKPAKLKRPKSLDDALKEHEALMNRIYGQKRSSDRYSDPEIYI